jgi:calcineurin-like phosphoesterase family protein
MDETIIDNWNRVVGDKDRVYHLGDVAINRRCLGMLSRLKGRIALVKGNHDIFKLDDYYGKVDDIRAYSILDGCILSHIPVHPESLRRFGCNVHGHLHYGRVLKNIKHGMIQNNIDPRYYNVACEMVDFTPINWEDLKKSIIEEGGSPFMKPRSEVYGPEM